MDFALKKDATVSPPRWLVFFKARDADALTAAFKEFTAKAIDRYHEKPTAQIHDSDTITRLLKNILI